MIETKVQLPRFDLQISGIQNFEGDRPEVIALHGWLDNCHSFKSLLSEMNEQKILAIDLPGHGRSDHHLPSQISHFHDYIFFIAELLKSLDLDRCHLIGHSMGGAIASLYAACFPDRVRSLALIESIGPLSLAEDEAPSRMAQAVESWLRNGGRTNPYYDDLDAAIQTRQKSGNLSYEIAKTLTVRGTRATPDGIQWTHDPRLKLPSARLYSEPQVQAYLKSIECPTLFIRGNNTFLSNAALVEQRLEMVKQLSQITVSGGHHLHMESPGELAKIIGQFLDVGHL
ncbi:alpha/beta fold hydrolase [Pseudobacteriovorax antillogorgiicola]|uniref:Pimeloyl-ACP methyl ester carboxylesterase n=1 Tax=Pseudobacteriovorax antillogorgiicola TaxID=1513793 RepID=A0A1Y6CDU9_9BACT|nr:alpha/beta hydrolase [Pseudobacteriovorax antillogorgiicola]TCS51722.1 pimeloyl-ACP methyl ester carboxylesterase [Pseudobacteriovorax antillogorgiicola]SMF49442.1 Pimeloyl-ACP methyl ester carboxylesterase [Pseudobacteriovorax antillogorgiicola]